MDLVILLLPLNMYMWEGIGDCSKVVLYMIVGTTGDQEF
jgi:hypothetical protein